MTSSAVGRWARALLPLVAGAGLGTLAGAAYGALVGGVHWAVSGALGRAPLLAAWSAAAAGALGLAFGVGGRRLVGAEGIHRVAGAHAGPVGVSRPQPREENPLAWVRRR
jgi:hypothetical protein